MRKPIKSVVTVLFLFLMGTFLSPLPANSSVYSADPSNLDVTNEFENGDCHLVVLQDGSDVKVLAKMVRSSDSEEQALLIIDCLGAEIAELISLPINRVQLLSDQSSWSNCDWFERLATLHQWVPGESTEDVPPWEGFSLQQRFREKGSPAWERWGSLPKERKGLSREVLATMAEHEDLARIAALDTFLGNADRSRPNLFYCKESQRFWGIDLAASFRRPLAKIAVEQLQQLGGELTAREMEGLRVYRETLYLLHDTVSPAFVRTRLAQLAEYSNLTGIENRMAAAGRKFTQNYKDTGELLQVLDGLL